MHTSVQLYIKEANSGSSHKIWGCYAPRPLTLWSILIIHEVSQSPTENDSCQPDKEIAALNKLKTFLCQKVDYQHPQWSLTAQKKCEFYPKTLTESLRFRTIALEMLMLLHPLLHRRSRESFKSLASRTPFISLATHKYNGKPVNRTKTYHVARNRDVLIFNNKNMENALSRNQG